MAVEKLSNKNDGKKKEKGKPDGNVSISLLRATLESTADGILVVDREGKVISYNEKFRKMWKIPKSVMNSGIDKNALGYVLKQLKDPDGFVNKVMQLYAEPESDVFDEIEFSDGRIYERYSIPQRLGDEIVGRVFSFRDVTKRKQMESQLIEQAVSDALTSLPNRFLLVDRINQAIKDAKRNKDCVAILFFDLDRFKLVNDSLGHNTGDALLLSISQRLSQCIRESDTLARWGGDEFVMVIPNLQKKEDVTPIIEHCLKVISETYLIDNHQLSITSSVGACFYPYDGVDPDALLKNADAAMYSAKKMGCNNYSFYKSQMNDNVAEQLELVNDLRAAIEFDQFVLHYQPIIDINKGCIVSAEALIRWEHPKRGLVPPLEFISLLEDTGLINPVGEWVIHTACAQNKKWQEMGLPPISVAVNVSSIQFRQKDMTSVVREALVKSGLDAKYLELEITESSLMENMHAFLNTIMEIKSEGASLVIDDFGTGYSSLAYLKKFPVDKIKIDKSFIDNLTQDKDDESIVQAILAMANKLNLRIVAEGVESFDQLLVLKESQCKEIQGYLFCKPLPAKEFEQYLRDQYKPFALKKLIELESRKLIDSERNVKRG